MKMLKKLVVTFLVAAMVVGVMPVYTTNAAKTEVKIRNGKTRKIYVGEKSIIVYSVLPKGVSQKVTFKSSKKSIAKVTKKGVITAKKPGKAVITVKTKDGSNKKAKINVTVLPAKVKGVKASSTLGTKPTINVSWKAQKNVTGYKVLVSKKAKSGYKVAATVKGAKKNSTTLNMSASGEYYVKVRAYKTLSGKELKGKLSAATDAVKVWKLTWSDEFNGSTLDTSVWNFEVGAIDTGNRELQTYTDKNYKMENGNLVIIPRMEIVNGTKTFTSTRINSSGKKSFKYGKIEIRAKGTDADGTWSAGWMLGNSIKTDGWPKCGEIDIVEIMNGHVPQTIHCQMFNNSKQNKNFDTLGLTQAEASKNYHVYGVEWTDKKMIFTVDGRVNGVYDPSGYSASNYADAWSDSFMQEFYFIFNCAIGGNAAGEKYTAADIYTTNWTDLGTINGVRTYEDYFYIDYVRVYQ